jgi:hypothetical protein
VNRMSQVVAGLLAIAAAALGAVKLISDGLGGGGANEGKGKPVKIASAVDYDPQGDAEEGAGEVELAVDGNPTGSAWESEHYDSETFAGTKSGPNPGVGIYVTAAGPARPARMLVRTPTPGWDAEIYAVADGPPALLSEWGEPVGSLADASSLSEIDLDVRRPATYFLLWFTKASEARDQAGRYQVEISDIRLLGEGS